MNKQLSSKFFSQDANNLISIGKLIAYDIAMNNPTRFPIQSIWPKFQGNIKNILFATEKPEYIKAEEWDKE